MELESYTNRSKRRRSNGGAYNQAREVETPTIKAGGGVRYSAEVAAAAFKKFLPFLISGASPS